MAYNNAPVNRPQAPAPIKIDGFYVDKKDKKVKPDLFDKTAEKIASTFFIENTKIGVSTTQLRRLFDEVKRFEQIFDADPSQWDKQIPYIKMINSKVSYAVARAKKNKPNEEGVYNNLSEFIKGGGIDLIHDIEDYRVFVALFEAVYGFYYEKAPKNAQD